MEARKFEQPRDTACSFETFLHPDYEAIKTACEPWILTLAEPTSPTAAEFWLNSLYPFLTCLAYPHCPADRVTNIAKFLIWIFLADDEDDDPALLGCHSINAPIMCQRHKLILACHTGDDPLPQANLHDNADHPRTIRSVKLLREVWRAMCKDMSVRLQVRLYEGMRDYLNAVALQAHYRSTGHVPTIEEYIAIRRPCSIMAVCFIFLEYALGIELDDESLQNENIQQLNDGGVDHIAFTNDIMSCHVELSKGDQFNLPAVIYWNNVMKGKADMPECRKFAGFTFQDAMQGAVRMLEDVDAQCLQLTKELGNSKLMKKPGVEAYMNGIGTWIAANRIWSLTTARYSHTCAPEQGLVVAVEQQELT